MSFTLLQKKNETILLDMQIFHDERGFFSETYKKSDFQKIGIDADFVQDNHSFSKKGVIRALHYQLPPFAQGKLIQVLSGEIIDIAVDLRKSSAMFKQYTAVKLSGENHHLFYIPPGFGHGFMALSDNVHLLYKCTAEYSKEYERGIRWDDPILNLPWGNTCTPIISEKDKKLPFLQNAEIFE
ncbi:MAG: dTDP-4-dehydrorhamnose 3,5-epimerase [Spirochaetales bacterium]|nr:dTDP-4-dehydrorhamnose 3,5-epimerase [Spirochaetales bacterium]